MLKKSIRHTPAAKSAAPMGRRPASTRRRASSLAARSALRKWVQAESLSALRQRWASSAPPLPSLDIDKPRWAIVLTTLPALLPASRRSGCDMLMGLAAPGAPPTDWASAMRRAERIFDAAAARAGQSATLHVSRHRGAQASGPWCDGRCHLTMPAYGSLSGFSMMFSEKRPLFDHRRAARRLGKPTPALWMSTYGQLADRLWACGLSSRRERALRFDKWTACVGAIAQAMAETGLDTRLCEGFFAKFPSTLDERSAMERVDQGRLDELRSRWTLESASPAAGPRHGKRAL